ncbi:hypothetical protein HY256_10130 [Candidatus Sumerlaeota bacterium]|nr:hypothetical protein [Candidatus Sumerlaeota bacterium]
MGSSHEQPDYSGQFRRSGSEDSPNYGRSDSDDQRYTTRRSRQAEEFSTSPPASGQPGGDSGSHRGRTERSRGRDSGSGSSPAPNPRSDSGGEGRNRPADHPREDQPSGDRSRDGERHRDHDANPPSGKTPPESKPNRPPREEPPSHKDSGNESRGGHRDDNDQNGHDRDRGRGNADSDRPHDDAAPGGSKPSPGAEGHGGKNDNREGRGRSGYTDRTPKSGHDDQKGKEPADSRDDSHGGKWRKSAHEGGEIPAPVKHRVEEAAKIYHLKSEDARKEYHQQSAALHQERDARLDHHQRHEFSMIGDPKKLADGVVLDRDAHGKWNRVKFDSSIHHGDTNIKVVNKYITKIDIDVNHVHVHGPGCGHYFYSGIWHDWELGHVHTLWCGHFFFNGAYFSFGIGHVHGPGCGHFYDGGIWLSYGGALHHHYPGCGHYFWGGFWHDYSVYHVHYAGCGHFFYDGCWHDFPYAHIHGPGCGHYYDGCRWYVVGLPSRTYYDGCGYYYYDDCWHIYPETYYHICRPRSFYFFVDLGGYDDRYVPTYVRAYQERYDEPEPVAIYQKQNDPLADAYADFAKKDYYRALVGFNDAIARNPDDGLLYFARAQTYISIADYPSAYADIVKGMELIPDWGQVRFNMTELYSDPDEFKDQLKNLEAWVEKYPRDYRAHFVLGYVYYFIQEYDLAKEELVYTLAYSPDHAQAKRLIEDIYDRQAEEGDDDAPALQAKSSKQIPG